VGIFLLDLRGNIKAVNRRGCMIYGYTGEEMLELNVQDIVPRRIAGNYPRLVEDLRKKKYIFAESEGKRKNRKLFPLELSINLFRWEGKDSVQVLVQDITNRKEAEAAEQLRRLSEKLIKYQEEERKHIARELHDHIGQDLAAIKISLQMLEKEYPEMEDGLWDEIEEVVRIADNTIADVRRISATLRPESLDRMGLVPALEHQIEYLSGRGDTKLTFHSRDFKVRLAPEDEIAIYRIVQEGITNILKHAQAGNARVRISRKGKNIHLSIRDDGVGFTPGWEKATMGLGLVGIKERVKGLGGEFAIKSKGGKGAELLITIPMLEKRL
jgi:PAS domain S-box-containing protein